MPNIDHLLQCSVEELKSFTDEQLLAHYAEVFNLEPKVPVNAIVEADDDEDEEGSSGEPRQRKPRQKKTAEKKTKMALLKEQILNASQGSFEEDFKL